MRHVRPLFWSRRKNLRDARTRQAQPPGVHSFSDRAKLPITEFALGLILVIASYVSKAGNDFSASRAWGLLGLCGAICVYGFLRSPYAPFYCYAILSPIYPSFGTSWALIIGGVILLLLNREENNWKWRFSFAGFAFCLWGILSQFWAVKIDLSQDGFLLQTFPMMVLTMAISGIQDRIFRRNLILMVVLSCAIGCVATLRNWHLDVESDFSKQGRIDSLIRPDIFSCWAIFGLLGTIALLEGERLVQWLRWTLIALLPLYFVGVGLSGYRAAILAATLGSAVAVFCGRRLMPALVVSAAIASGMVVLYFASPDMFSPVIGRMQTIREDRGSDRLDIWESALRLFPQSPVAGNGWDSFPVVVAKNYHSQFMSHNIYIGALIELGGVGLTLLLWWLLILLRAAWQEKHRVCLFPLMIAFCFQAMFIHLFAFGCFWLALGLAESARGSVALTTRRDSLQVRLRTVRQCSQKH